MSASADLCTSVVEGLRLLHREGELFEVRVFDTDRVDSGYFTDPQRAAAAIEAHAARNPIATFCMTLNPIDPAGLNGHAIDRIQRGVRATTCDKAIMRRRWLLLDIDADRPANTSSTDVELRRALDRRDAVRTYLVAEQGWPEPYVAMSGNGGHLGFALDLPVNEQTDAAVKGVLNALARKYSDDAVEIDTVVGNPSRVCKVYGTIARKGIATAERPHRLAEIEVVPDVFVPVTLAQLQAVAALAPSNGSGLRRATTPPSAARQPSSSSVLDMAAEFSARGWYLRALSGGKHAVTCPWVTEHSGNSGPSETCLFEPREPDGVWGFKCQHAHCAGRTIRDVWELVRPSDAKWNGNWPHWRGRASEASFRSTGDAAQDAPEADPRDNGGPAGGVRGRIVIEGGKLSAIVDQAEAALLARVSIFQRGGLLTRAVKLDSSVKVEPHVRREPGSTVLIAVREPWLGAQMGLVLEWYRTDRNGVLHPTDVPALYPRTMLNRGEWRFPVLRGVVTAPTLGRDGDIIETPGFHAASGLLVDVILAFFPSSRWRRLTTTRSRLWHGSLSRCVDSRSWMAPRGQ